MEYALYLLPYILQVPPRKGKRPSSDEVACHFIQFHPVCTISVIYCSPLLSGSFEGILSKLFSPVLCGDCIVVGISQVTG